MVKFFSNKQSTPTPVAVDTGGNLFELTHEELVFIANCTDLNEMREKMAKHITVLDHIAKSRTKHLPFNNQRYSQAISSALTDAPSFPIVILWTIMTSLASIGMLTITLLTAGMTALAFVLAGFYLWSIHSDLGEEKKNKRNEIECQTIRLAALTELNRREHLLSGTTPQPTTPTPPAKSTWRTKLPPRLVRRMIDTGMVVSATLLCTYYVAINATLAILGMALAASAMATPIGIAVAVVIALGIGAFFAFKQYQLYQREVKLEQARKNLESECDSQETEYTNATHLRHKKRAFDRGEHHRSSSSEDDYTKWIAARGTRDDFHLTRTRYRDVSGQQRMFGNRRQRRPSHSPETFGALSVGFSDKLQPDRKL